MSSKSLEIWDYCSWNFIKRFLPKRKYTLIDEYELQDRIVTEEGFETKLGFCVARDFSHGRYLYITSPILAEAIKSVILWARIRWCIERALFKFIPGEVIKPYEGAPFNLRITFSVLIQTFLYYFNFPETFYSDTQIVKKREVELPETTGEAKEIMDIICSLPTKFTGEELDDIFLKYDRTVDRPIGD